MKLKNFCLFLLILIFFSLIIGNVSAADSFSSNTTLLNENQVDEVISDDCCDDTQITEEKSDETKTWYVAPDPENANQVQKPTVQPIINQANPGDTIVLNGSFIHCHFTINKTLNIIATPGTSLGVCPHHNHPTGSDSFGIFYVTSQAKGTVIEGFEFTNDFFSIANVKQNPFAILIDGASNIELKNLVINWTGVKVNEKEPDDYLFSPIIIKNAVNISLNNVYINNTLIGVNIINSTNIKILNSSVINSKESGINIGENSSNISVTDNKIKEEPSKIIQKEVKLVLSNLNVEINKNGYLQINLKESNGKPIANNSISIFVNGVLKTVKTDNDGNAKLPFSYGTAGTYYAVASFLGTDDYKSSFATAKIAVNKKSTSISSPKKTFKVKATKKIKITLKSGKSPLKSKKVYLTVKGKTFSVKTNSKGVATIKIKLNKKGSFKYTVKFAGDNIYKSVVSKSGKIIIK